MSDYLLPCSLVQALDDIGVGAVLKRLSGGVKAVFVDYIAEEIGGTLIVAVVKKKVRESYRYPKGREDYEFVEIQDSSDWIVLTMGVDEDLVECGEMK